MNVRLALPLATLLLASMGRTALAAEPAAAAELARIIVPKSTWSQGVDGLAQAVQTRMRSHPGLQYPDDFDAKVRSEMEQVLPYDEVVAMHAKELAAVYTPAEIDGLLAFYRGPLGQKSLEANPQVFEKAGIATQQRIDSKMGDAMKRLAEHAKKPAGASASPHGGSPHGASPGGATPPATPQKSPAAPAKKAPAPPAKKTSTPPAKADAAATPAPAPAPAPAK